MKPEEWIQQAQKPAVACDMDASDMVHPDSFVQAGVQLIRDLQKENQILQEAVAQWQDYVRAERDKASTLPGIA